MKKLTSFLWLFLVALCAFGCSAGPVDDVGELHEAIGPSGAACSINGSSGVVGSTVITKVKINSRFGGAYLEVDEFDPVTNVRDTHTITFKDVHWTPFHTTNGTTWSAWTDAYPLRRFTIKDPGCASSSPSSYCLVLEGDIGYSDHVSQFQNTEVFLIDRAVTPSIPVSGYPYTGRIEAPLGSGIARIEGMGTSPSNTLRVSVTGATYKDFKFTTPGCP